MRWPTASLSTPGACLALLLLASSAAFCSDAPGQYDVPRKTAQLPNGMTLGYIELGDSQNPPLIYLHGYTNSGRGYLPLGRLLAREHHVFLLDQRGHGASGKPECCYSRIDFAYDIKLFLDQLGIERADIAGHSLGSIVAQTFAAYWPERTRRLVLIATTAGQRSNSKPRKPQSTSTFGAATDAAIANLKDPIDPDSAFMREWWSIPGVDPELLAIVRRESAAIPASVWRAMLQQLGSSIDLRYTIGSIKAPTLLLFGGKDTLFGAKDRRELAAFLPTAKMVLFPQLGHSLPEQDPATVAASIQEFLSQ